MLFAATEHGMRNASWFAAARIEEAVASGGEHNRTRNEKPTLHFAYRWNFCRPVATATQAMCLARDDASWPVGQALVAADAEFNAEVQMLRGRAQTPQAGGSCTVRCDVPAQRANRILQIQRARKRKLYAAVALSKVVRESLTSGLIGNILDGVEQRTSTLRDPASD